MKERLGIPNDDGATLRHHTNCGQNIIYKEVIKEFCGSQRAESYSGFCFKCNKTIIKESKTKFITFDDHVCKDIVVRPKRTAPVPTQPDLSPILDAIKQIVNPQEKFDIGAFILETYGEYLDIDEDDERTPSEVLLAELKSSASTIKKLQKKPEKDALVISDLQRQVDEFPDKLRMETATLTQKITSMCHVINERDAEIYALKQAIAQLTQPDP